MKKMSRPLCCLAFFTVFVVGWLVGAPIFALSLKIQTLTMKPVPGMDRAVLKYGEVPAGCAGALVLCPGFNEDGEGLMKDEVWQAFARKHRFVIIGLSFSSSDADRRPEGRRGYYYPEKGSGKLLMDGVTKIVGKEVPIVLFGFSGGAHFAHRFAYHNPAKVKAWAAYSFAWGDPATSPDVKPPGIFVCGSDDERLNATFATFEIALANNWPVCWLEVANSDHAIDKNATRFIRDFLDATLQLPPKAPGIWVQIPRIDDEGVTKAWFPNEAIRDAWKKFRE